MKTCTQITDSGFRGFSFSGFHVVSPGRSRAGFFHVNAR